MATVYVGNLDPQADARDIRDDFDRYGKISDVWIARKPPGFAFIEFENERDARDAVRDMDGRFILEKRVRVEISRRGWTSLKVDGKRDRDSGRTGPLRTDHQVKISGLSSSSDWRNLKDFLRTVAEACFVDTVGGGEAIAEFKTSADRDLVVSKLDDTQFDGSYIRIRVTDEDGGGYYRRGSDGAISDHWRVGRDESGRDSDRSRDREPRGGRGDGDSGTARGEGCDWREKRRRDRSRS